MTDEAAAPGEYLKCDAPDCDHFEMTPVTIEVVDKPCPKCGANLCAAEDFLLFKTLSASSHAARELILRDKPETELTMVATNVHKGQIKIAHGPVAGVNPFPNSLSPAAQGE